MADDRLDNRSCTPVVFNVKKKQESKCLGRSCGGFSTKIHAVCDALGNPIRFILTARRELDF
jgi:hypothetical protein